MSTFQEINLNVKKINKLIERYERNNKASKVPNVLTDFKKRIKALADNLASDISDSEELKSRLKESKEILNGVKLATNTPETKRLPPKKARVVAIQETPDVISLLQPNYTELLEQIKQKAKRLNELEETYDSLCRTPLLSRKEKDPLINHLQQSVQASKQAFALIAKKERELYFLYLAYIDFFPAKLDEVKKTDESKENDIMEFIDYFKESDSENTTKLKDLWLTFARGVYKPKELDNPGLDYIQKKIAFLRKKYDCKNRHQWNEILFTTVEQLRVEQDKYDSVIENARHLTAERLGELKQAKGGTKSIGTDRDLAKLRNQLLTISRKEIEIMHSLKQPTPEEEDTDILELLDQIGQIRGEGIEKLIQSKNQEFSKLDAKDAYLHTPLEADRLIKKIHCLQTLLNNLDVIQKQPIPIFSDELREAIGKRETKAIEANNALKEKIKDVSDKIISIQREQEQPQLFESYQAEIKILEEEIHSALEKKAMTLDKENIISFTEKTKEHIQNIEKKLQEQIQRINSQNKIKIESLSELKKCVNQNLYFLIHRLQELVTIEEINPIDLKEVVNKKLSCEIDKFEQLVKLENSYKKKERAECRRYTVALDKHHDRIFEESQALLDKIQREIEKEIEMEKRNKIDARTTHPLAAAVGIMITSVENEMSKEQSPKSVQLLRKLNDELTRNLFCFTELEISPRQAIENFTNILRGNLSQNNLRELSDREKPSFVGFVRKLFEPLIPIIKKITGEKYRVSFFASPTETNIAKAAQSLNSLLAEKKDSTKKTKARPAV